MRSIVRWLSSNGIALWADLAWAASLVVSVIASVPVQQDPVYHWFLWDLPVSVGQRPLIISVLMALGLVGSHIAVNRQVQTERETHRADFQQQEEKHRVEMQSVRAELQSVRREMSKDHIDTLLRRLVNVTGKGKAKIRASVFLPKTDGRLHMEFCYNFDRAPDAGIVLEKHQGSTGDAWARGKQVLADLGEVSAEDLENVWKLTPTQIRLTQDVKSIVSTPIFDPRDRSSVVGALSVDSTRTLRASGIGSTESRDECLQAAAFLGQILSAGGFIGSQGET
ncbi:MAG: hypothetical protein ACYC4L_04575 [Chloroflexota bacterium]